MVTTLKMLYKSKHRGNVVVVFANELLKRRDNNTEKKIGHEAPYYKEMNNRT